MTPLLEGTPKKADTTKVDSPVFRLVLVDLPAGMSTQQLGTPRPLGEQSAVIARIVELLPGTTFSADGHGSFKRGSYQIAFAIEAPTPDSIAVEIDHHDGLVALKRVVAKTGWQIIDPAGGSLVDIEATAASGALVPLSAPTPGPVESTARQRSGSFRWVGVAVGIALVAGSIWFGWTSNHRPPTIEAHLSTSVAAPDSGLSAPALPAASSTMPAPGVPGPSTPADLDAAERSRIRMARMKSVVDQFRTNPIVTQLYDYRQAAAVFPSSVGGGGFMSPERLSNAAFFAAIHTHPYLPPSFAQPERDRYRFEFIGEDCTGTNPYLAFLVNLCKSFVYVARPLPGAPGRRSYALVSSDFRVHYRDQGGMPTLRDPAVDHTTPSPVVEMPKVEPRPQPKGSPGLVLSLRRAATDLIDGALGRKQAEVQLHESNAIQDLRTFAAAENLFHSTIGEGRYAAPEQLAAAEPFASLDMQPFLPAFFRQPLRQGYQFEFVGQKDVTPVGPLASLGLLHESFVYVARPIEPGPEGRRTFALYPDGRVFATSERRVPTTRDEQVRTS